MIEAVLAGCLGVSAVGSMTISLATLRSIKNNVIGNPCAKAKYAQDGTVPL